MNRLTLGVVTLLAAAVQTLLPPTARGATPVTLASPDGKIVITVAPDAQDQLTWSVQRGGTPPLSVLTPAALGLTVDGDDLGQKVTLGEPKRSSFQEEYPTLGNHSKAVSHYNEALIPVTHGAIAYEVAVRAFDDGVAVRYSVPLQGTHAIAREATSWGLPPDAAAWWSAYGYETVSKSGAFGQIPEASPLSRPSSCSPMRCRGSGSSRSQPQGR